MAKNKMVACKTCGQEIAKSAKVCPNCGAKQKGGKLKIILIVVVALIVIGALASGGNKSKETDSSSSSAKTEQAAEQKTGGEKTEEKKTEEQKPEEKKEEEAKETQTITDETLIRDDFKQAMDSYEVFFDEYVETVRLYKENPTDAEILAQYSDMLAREATMLKEFDEWESEDMTTAEAAYYLEVHSRIYAKLAEVV